MRTDVNKVAVWTITLLSLALVGFSDRVRGKSAYQQSDDSGGGYFRKGAQVLGDTRSFGVYLADVDLDGDQDVFLANYIESCQLWINAGDDQFIQSEQRFNRHSVHGAGFTDLNGDSYPDLFLVQHNADHSVFLNDGTGAFINSGQNIRSEASNPTTVRLGDVDGDDDVDAVLLYPSAPNKLWLNDGTGTFTETAENYGTNTTDLGLKDLNGDSFPDLVLIFRNDLDEIWMNDGTGRFIFNGQRFDSQAESIEIHDIDSDGDLDILAFHFDQITFWLNQNNAGTFMESGRLPEGAIRVALLDADQDGDADLVTTHLGNGHKLWVNDGSASFSVAGTIFGPKRVLSIVCGDLNGDDIDDIVLGLLEGSGGNPVYFNQRAQGGDSTTFGTGDGYVQAEDPPTAPSTEGSQEQHR